MGVKRVLPGGMTATEWTAKLDEASSSAKGLLGQLAAAGVPSFNGIKFPASQVASADANTLDDYEEGTFTPSLGGTATYGSQSGYYCRIGRIVFIEIQFQVTSIGSGSTTDISGLPFTPASDNFSGISFGYWEDLATSVVHLVGRVTSGGAVTVYSMTAAGAVVGANAMFKNGTNVRLGGFYEIR